MIPPNPAARTAPSVERNRGPILEVLRSVAPASGLVLEIASGSGEHAVWFSAALPHLTWQPTDQDPAALASIAAWRCVAAPNLQPPTRLDARAAEWPVVSADMIVSINMVHIAPWAAAEGLMAGAGRLLPPGGVLFLYGPFREGARPLAPGNVAFDADLRLRNPQWGLRDVADIISLALSNGLQLEQTVRMPAENLVLVFRPYLVPVNA